MLIQVEYYPTCLSSIATSPQLFSLNMINKTFQAVSPIDNQLLDGNFVNADAQQIDEVVQQAVNAFQVYKKKSPEEKAKFLTQAATEIENLGEALIERCHLETALPHGRLTGERGRTVNQLRLFARVVREGSWVDARIDTPIPERTPFPKVDIRHVLQPFGPVAVFGASNFPLAFSTAGGDTASALAAGCPVIVKGHPAHPGTAEMVAGAILKAAKETGMPEGTFSLLQGNSYEVGEYLVKHPGLKAVGFTGSFKGGQAIWAHANARPEPIPVFAEMGSTNPVFILPDAMEERAQQIAEGMAGSINLGVGQFCTNPGLTFISKGKSSDTFLKALSENISQTAATTMLTSGIKQAYDEGRIRLAGLHEVKSLAEGKSEQAPNQAVSQVFHTDINTFLKEEELEEEVFGPSSILITYQQKADILQAANRLRGHLTATVHATEKDLEEFGELFNILEQKVGRVILNGYPTGVEVCDSMVHGGPYPATTAPSSTSVGTNAIKRFARPVCYQGYPDALLPAALKHSNPLDIWRMVDGELTKGKG